VRVRTSRREEEAEEEEEEELQNTRAARRVRFDMALPQELGARKPQTNIEVKMFTCGYKQHSLPHPNSYQSRGQLRRDIEKQVGFRFDYVYNCLQLKEPPGDCARFKYCGEHYSNMQGLLESECLPDVLSELKRNFREAVECHRRSLSLVFICRSGRHRSVGARRFAEHCLRSEGATITMIKHLSCDGWHAGFCTSCSSCGPESNDRRTPLIKGCLEMWDSM